MKHLSWIVTAAVVIAGLLIYRFGHVPLLRRCAALAEENEMWIAKAEQVKRDARLNQTRQRLAPDVSFLLADIFTSPDSFKLTPFARDTLAALANELRTVAGEIRVAVYTDDSNTALTTKVRYPNAFAYAAARGAVVIGYLQSQGIPGDRMVLLAQGQGRDRGATIPEVQALASRRLEISVLARAK